MTIDNKTNHIVFHCPYRSKDSEEKDYSLTHLVTEVFVEQPRHHRFC